MNTEAKAPLRGRLFSDLISVCASGVLTDANARLGADVDRYSFTVVDLHHLLLAGLPAHFESYMPSQPVRSSPRKR
jgi:hypothetical protein